MYWEKVLEEVLNKDDPSYSMVLTNSRGVKGYRSRFKSPTSSQNKPAPQQKSTQLSGRPKKYFLGKNFGSIYFTRREAQVMLALINGMNIPNIAKVLKLSARTVEFYVNNMKTKLRCQRKCDLVAKVLSSDFLSLLDFDIPYFDVEKQNNEWTG